MVINISDLAPTSNNLADIVRWLKNGYIVVIHTTAVQTRVFLPDNLTETTRIIFVNVSTMASLLDDGEWNYYISESNFREITNGDLKREIMESNREKVHLRVRF